MITAVRMLRQPDSGPTSAAVPRLLEETLRAQSADVDSVSGATMTSEAHTGLPPGRLSGPSDRAIVVLDGTGGGTMTRRRRGWGSGRWVVVWPAPGWQRFSRN